MDAVSTAATVVKGATLTDKAVGWFRKWRGGSVKISTPTNRDVLAVQPWIAVSGVHANAKGTYWLLTHNGDKYWPQNKITLEHDCRWTARANVDTKAATRTSWIVVARVGDFANAIFEDFKVRGARTGIWDPLRLPAASKELTIVDEVAVTVLGSGSGATTN